MEMKRLDEIQAEYEDSLEAAERIMNGGDNYDGADGAREVIILCRRIQELILAIRTSEASK